jgi:NAD(P)H-hydrate epimerase
VGPPYARLIEAINGLGLAILAVDIPSGLDCDTGLPGGAAIRAACTVTFVALKTGFLSPQSRSYTGNVTVASIGVDPRCLASHRPPPSRGGAGQS